MATCPHCHGILPEAAAVCPNCGQPVSRPQSALSPSQIPLPQTLALGEYLKKGRDLFKLYPGGFIGYFLVNLIIQVVVQSVPKIGWLFAVILGPPLMMGNFIVTAKLLQQQRPEFSDFFAGFQFFLPLLLLAVISSVLVLIGFFLLFIPGVYLMVSYLFASSLVVDRRLDFWPALELSRRTITPQWFTFFAFLLLLALVNVAGALALGVGMVVSVPVSICALTAAYADIFGLQSDYSGKVPRLR